MSKPNLCDRRTRTGFTLVEMLVVMGFLLVLATLTVAIAPRFQERQKVAKAADQLQGWLLIAKQRAKNDRAPTGVRIYVPSNQPLLSNQPLATDLAYIQRPDDFRPGANPGGGFRWAQIAVPNPGNQVVLTPPPPLQTLPADFAGGAAPSNKALWPVQPGDYLEIKGGGLLHQIVAPVLPNQLQVFSPFPYAIAPTDDYRIIREPRLLQGETPLQLAQDVAIDFAPSPYPLYATSNTSLGFPRLVQANTPLDILFAPSGALLKPVATGDKIMLWLRDPTQDAKNPGDQILITIQVRTGLIAAHPVDPPPSTDPYSFAKDPRSSGL
jgi:type II secretory pathway pseudopilin PulG